jgi:hypothetical protein
MKFLKVRLIKLTHFVVIIPLSCLGSYFDLFHYRDGSFLINRKLCRILVLILHNYGTVSGQLRDQDTMSIKTLSPEYLGQWVHLRQQLWPEQNA